MAKHQSRNVLLLAALTLPLLGACHPAATSSEQGTSAASETPSSVTPTPSTTSNPPIPVPSVADPEADYKVTSAQFASLTSAEHFANVTVDSYSSDTGFPSSMNDPHNHVQIADGIALAKDVGTDNIGADSYFALEEGTLLMCEAGKEDAAISASPSSAYSTIADYLTSDYGIEVTPAYAGGHIQAASFDRYVYDETLHAYTTITPRGTYEDVQTFYFAHGELLKITNIYRESGTTTGGSYTECDYSAFGTSVSMSADLQAGFRLTAYRITKANYQTSFGPGGFEKANWMYTLRAEKTITSDGTMTSHKQGVYEAGLHLRVTDLSSQKGTIYDGNGLGVAMVAFDGGAATANPLYSTLTTLESVRFGNTFEKFYEPIAYGSLTFNLTKKIYEGNLATGESVSLAFKGNRLLEEKVVGTTSGVTIGADYVYTDYYTSSIALNAAEKAALALSMRYVDGFVSPKAGAKLLDPETLGTKTAKVTSYSKEKEADADWTSKEVVTIDGDKIKCLGTGNATSFIAQKIDAANYAYIELKPDGVSVNGAGHTAAYSGGYIATVGGNDAVAGLLDVPTDPTKLALDSNNHYVAAIGDDHYDFACEYGNFKTEIYANATIGSGVYNKHEYDFYGYSVHLTSEQSQALKNLGAAG